MASMVTCTAPVNIALIKYWGKRDEELIIPLAGSLSITLNQDELCSKTTVAFSKNFTEDRFWLNGEEQSLSHPRLAACLKEIRRRAAAASSSSSGHYRDNTNPARYVHIASVNNFPTAAGLASSASGFACLVVALAHIYGVKGDISDVARRGSGSACRSVYGGFVEWVQGEASDGSDSIARQVAAQEHWPDIHVLVCVVGEGRKSVPSTEAMRRSVKTSAFINQWAKVCTPQQLKDIKVAIEKKDFATVANISMKSSNQFHALCLDTFPPVAYMCDISHAIVRLVHAYNSLYGETRVLYTFDAGPNACLMLPKSYVEDFGAFLLHFFPPLPAQEGSYIRGLHVGNSKLDETEFPTSAYTDFLKQVNVEVKPGSLKFIIHTKVGDGPRVVHDESQHLLDINGLPISKS